MVCLRSISFFSFSQSLTCSSFITDNFSSRVSVSLSIHSFSSKFLCRISFSAFVTFKRISFFTFSTLILFGKIASEQIEIFNALPSIALRNSSPNVPTSFHPCDEWFSSTQEAQQIFLHLGQ